jgi:hypothetical protein
MKIGGNEVEMLYVSIFEVLDNRGEVGHSINSEVVEMDSPIRNTSSAKNLTGFVGGATRGNPNFQRWISLGKFSGELFPVYTAA